LVNNEDVNLKYQVTERGRRRIDLVIIIPEEVGTAE
jgi:hypothetical protein